MSKAKPGFLRGFFVGFILTFALIGTFAIIKNATEDGGRLPAAVDKSRIFDVSYLEGGALKAASAKQLLSPTEVFEGDESVTINFGHFVARAPTGERQLLCDIYDQVELTFEAEGVAVNGERAKLKVLAPCSVSENLNKMKSIVIPTAQIKRLPTTDGEFSFGDLPSYYFSAYHLPDSWPETWVMTEFKLLKRNDPGVSLSLDRREVYNFSSKPIMMNW